MIGEDPGCDPSVNVQPRAVQALVKLADGGVAEEFDGTPASTPWRFAISCAKLTPMSDPSGAADFNALVVRTVKSPREGSTNWSAKTPAKKFPAGYRVAEPPAR